MSFNLVNAPNGQTLQHGQGTTIIDCQALVADGASPGNVTRADSVQVVPIIDDATGQLSQFVCKLVLPANETFTGTLSVLCYSPQILT